MKRILILIVTLLCILSLSACKLPFALGSSGDTKNTTDESTVGAPPTPSAPTDTTTSADTEPAPTDTTTSADTEPAPTDTTASADTEPAPTETTTAPETTVPTETTAAPETTDAPSTETDTDAPEPPAPVDPSAHTAIAWTDYYQYSHMTAEEKIAYARIREAVEVYQNDVDISDLSLNAEQIIALVERFIADHPQLFWISPAYGYLTEDDVPTAIQLQYTDGVHSDDGEHTADRAVIAARRAEFDRRVNEILSMIDPTLTDYEKELLIHDHLTRTMRYDSEAAKNPTVDGTFTDAFCAYGALIDKSAVCEGYTEAFQYLCYRVGINANQVLGIGHVWNVVQIGGEWYQTDVTWDDPINQFGASGDGNHNYFNLTAEEMYRAHEPDPASHLRIPECTATEHAYREETAPL